MGSEVKKCSMVGCKRPVYRALAIAPATVVELCDEHYKEAKEELDAGKVA